MIEYTHIVVLIEDKSGEILVEKILQKYADGDSNFSYDIKSFKGLGKIPCKKGNFSAIKSGRLLTDLPQYLRGYDASLKQMVCQKAIFVILDRDDSDCALLKASLLEMYDNLNLSIKVFFCIAVEEMEAWLLGDENAVLTAFPSAKLSLLHKYENDSIIGTWERLADIVYPGGVRQLKRDAGAYYGIDKFKCDCAEKIGSVMDIRHNMSPSFNYFLGKLDCVCKDSK